MSLFKKISNWWREKAENAEKSMTDVRRDAKFAIKDFEEDLRKKKSGVAKHIASVKRAEDELESAKGDVGKWKQILHAAETASPQNPSDVSQAAERLSDAKSKAVNKKKRVDRAHQLLTTLKKRISEMENQLRRFRDDADDFAAEDLVADLMDAVNADGGDNTPADEMEKLRDHTRARTYEAEANAEMATTADDRLEDRYKSCSVDDEYEAMFGVSTVTSPTPEPLRSPQAVEPARAPEPTVQAETDPTPSSYDPPSTSSSGFSSSGGSGGGGSDFGGGGCGGGDCGGGGCD